MAQPVTHNLTALQKFGATVSTHEKKFQALVYGSAFAALLVPSILSNRYLEAGSVAVVGTTSLCILKKIYHDKAASIITDKQSALLSKIQEQHTIFTALKALLEAKTPLNKVKEELKKKNIEIDPALDQMSANLESWDQELMSISKLRKTASYQVLPEVPADSPFMASKKANLNSSTPYFKHNLQPDSSVDSLGDMMARAPGVALCEAHDKIDTYATNAFATLETKREIPPYFSSGMWKVTAVAAFIFMAWYSGNSQTAQLVRLVR